MRTFMCGKKKLEANVEAERTRKRMGGESVLLCLCTKFSLARQAYHAPMEPLSSSPGYMLAVGRNRFRERRSAAWARLAIPLEVKDSAIPRPMACSAHTGWLLIAHWPQQLVTISICS